MTNNNNDSYFSSSSDKSTMRLIVVFITMVVALALLLVTISAVILTIKGKTVDWMGISAFVGAITLILGTVITGKVTQKGIENKKS